MRKLRLSLLLISLVIGFSIQVINGNLSSNVIYGTHTNYELKIYTDSPLEILGNSQLNNTASSGNGTKISPYLIEDLVIDANCTGKTGIWILDTNAHFILQNCTVLATDTNREGIYLFNVTNCKVVNCTIKNSYWGIKLYASSNNTLINNTVTHNERGIYLESACQNNVFINNKLYDNSKYGIRISESNNITFTNNSCGGSQDFGVWLWHSSLNYIAGNILSNNSQYGIFLEFCSDNNSITQNIINANQKYGIYIQQSNYNNITWNEMLDNEIDYIYEGTLSIGNLISDNTIQHEGPNGIPSYMWVLFAFAIIIPAIIIIVILIVFKKPEFEIEEEEYEDYSE